MSSVSLRSEWTLTLTTEKMVLVLKALGGRLTLDDILAARELGDDLTRQRIVATDNAIKWNKKLMENYAAATGDTIDLNCDDPRTSM